MGQAKEKGERLNTGLFKNPYDCGNLETTIKVRINNTMVDVCKWLDIGKSFKKYSSPDIAIKINIITKTQFSIDNKMEETIMNKYALKYTAEEDGTTTKRCITRLRTVNSISSTLLLL